MLLSFEIHYFSLVVTVNTLINGKKKKLVIWWGSKKLDISIGCDLWFKCSIKFTGPIATRVKVQWPNWNWSESSMTSNAIDMLTLGDMLAYCYETCYLDSSAQTPSHCDAPCLDMELSKQKNSFVNFKEQNSKFQSTSLQNPTWKWQIIF